MGNNGDSAGGRGKILITGNAGKTAGDIRDLTAGEYCVDSVPTAGGLLEKKLREFRPNVVVICLQDETRDVFKNYGVFITDMDYADIPLMITGKEDDCFNFRGKLPAADMETFSAPLNQGAFLETLRHKVNHSLQMSQLSIFEAEMEEPEFEYGSGMEAYTDITAGVQTASQGKEERQTILVVDDDVQMLHVIKLYLQEEYSVATVPSGKLAMKYLDKKSPDLVLLDYMMPEMDGPAVLREIREHSDHPEIPVIFLTGVSDKDCVLKGLELRPNSYLLKPVSKELLLQRLHRVLSGS